MTDKEKYMREALKEARKALALDEVPIGAVVVKDGKIIGRGYNKRNTSGIATSHAEVLAINKACKKMGDWRLEGGEIYVTLEPCSMCAGAIINSRIDKIYFGAYERKSGAVLSNLNIPFRSGLNHVSSVEGGILYEECSNILKEYFQSKRV